ncbi:MAG TPA: ABC transporter permease [Candidatus Dormibacteraeota bacterium]|nr:ABC transporter permease [Candidatus Dormibacteraeota bacterium]
MFLRLVSDSFTRRPRRKLFTGAALALGMAVATAALSVSLDVGDRLAREFRSLGANLIVTPQADSLPLEIGGVDYRPVNSGAYLPESDLPKIKSVFWHNNIIAFAPLLEIPVQVWSPASKNWSSPGIVAGVSLMGTWANRPVYLNDGSTFVTGIDKTNPWFQIEGKWFAPDAGTTKRVNVPLPPGAGAGHTYVPVPNECVVGAKLATRIGVHIGNQLNVTLPDREQMQAYSGTQNMSCAITGILSTGGPEEDAVLMPIGPVQWLARKPGQYRKLYVSALTKPEDDFARRNIKTMSRDEFERWSCSPYVSSIAYSIQQVLPGSDVRVIRRVAEGEGAILTRVRILLWLVTAASLLAAALAVGASSAASVIERRTEIGLMKALGAASAKVGFLLAAEQLLLAFVGGGVGYAIGILLARILGQTVFGIAPQPSLLVLFLVLALAATVTLLGSAIPLRRASRYEPAPILRGE